MNDTLNPFDPASFRLDQSFTDATAVKKLLLTIPVRKTPPKQEFVRVHPDPAYTLSPVAIVELENDRETYLVAPDVAADLIGETIYVTLHTAITRQGVVFLWRVRTPGPDGKHNQWHQSNEMAAEIAVKKWVRVGSNLPLGAYEVSEATANIPDPEWPDKTFGELLKIAFQGRVIDRLDHPVILQLRGAV